MQQRRSDLSRHISAAIESARRTGRHSYRGAWQFAAGSPLEEVAEAVVHWCRETLAGCRRPFGINVFDLAVTLGAPFEGESGALRFTKLEPISLYSGTMADDFVAALGGQVGAQNDAPLDVRVALFSWGDAAYDAVKRE